MRLEHEIIEFCNKKGKFVAFCSDRVKCRYIIWTSTITTWQQGNDLSCKETYRCWL